MFKSQPFETDMLTLSYLKACGNNLAKSMLGQILKSQPTKITKEVEVHGKTKVFWREQQVNADDGKSDTKSSSAKPSTTKTKTVQTHQNSKSKTIKPPSNTTLTLEQKKAIKNNGKYPTKNLPMDKIARVVMEGGVKYRDLRNIDSTEAFFGYVKSLFTWNKDHPWGKWVLSRTKEDIKAIDEYTGGELTYPTNSFLRQIDHPHNNDGKYDEEQVNNIGLLVKALDHVIDSAEVVEPFITYRKMRRVSDDGEDLLNDFKHPDGIYQDNAYVSTSPIPDTFDTGDEASINMRIRVPPGKGVGAWMRPYSQVPDEYEFLLARGSQFKVLSITEKDDETTVELEWIGTAAQDFGDIEDSMDDKDMIKYKGDD